MTDGIANAAGPGTDGAFVGSVGLRQRRLQLIDAIRGAAILGVVLFHLVWDLAYLGLTSQALAQHPLWIAFGRGLAGTFMILVGVSLVLANRGGLNRRAFLRRLGLLALAAAAGSRR
ncbi:MAG: heparan-alpha-glucosaminide N-acetyltransferase domain-containing protein [Shimia sp.]